jgi:hypothetical protein
VLPIHLVGADNEHEERGNRRNEVLSRLARPMLSPTRDMKAARRFFRSARSVAGFVPDRVTTDGHNSYPRAIRSTLGRDVRHRTSVYLNDRLEQDHRGIKGPIRCMRGFKEHEAADRFCREYDELRTSSAAGPVTISTFRQPADAVTFSSTAAVANGRDGWWKAAVWLQLDLRPQPYLEPAQQQVGCAS